MVNSKFSVSFIFTLLLAIFVSQLQCVTSSTSTKIFQTVKKLEDHYSNLKGKGATPDRDAQMVLKSVEIFKKKLKGFYDMHWNWSMAESLIDTDLKNHLVVFPETKFCNMKVKSFWGLERRPEMYDPEDPTRDIAVDPTEIIKYFKTKEPNLFKHPLTELDLKNISNRLGNVFRFVEYSSHRKKKIGSQRLYKFFNETFETDPSIQETVTNLETITIPYLKHKSQMHIREAEFLEDAIAKLKDKIEEVYYKSQLMRGLHEEMLDDVLMSKLNLTDPKFSSVMALYRYFDKELERWDIEDRENLKLLHRLAGKLLMATELSDRNKKLSREKFDDIVLSARNKKSHPIFRTYKKSNEVFQNEYEKLASFFFFNADDSKNKKKTIHPSVILKQS